MSIQLRTEVATSPSMIYRSNMQQQDIMNPQATQTQLIAMLFYLLQHGATLEVTSVRADHDDDLFLNPTPPHCGTHAGGWAIDCWPLSEPKEGAYLDPAEEQFAHFLRLLAGAPFLRQIGLGGSSFTAMDMISAGITAFENSPQDHVHIGVQSD